LEDFCIWAGRNAVTSNSGKILANSLRKYIAGLKAWHIYHDKDFPSSNATRIQLLIKASSREDELAARAGKKLPIMLWHMTYLWQTLRSGDDFNNALLDVCIVAFWGLARMAELTYTSEKGDVAFAESVLTSDVFFSSGGGREIVTLTVRNSKTGSPGHPQIITLGKHKHALCPVNAIRRRIAAAEGQHTSLFGYNLTSGQRHVTRRLAVKRLEEILAEGGFHGLKGHSFQVGGASLRIALGISRADLCVLGRWKSDCYKLYIRDYSAEDLSKTRTLLRTFRRSWKQMML
jgi:hypothetical protein